MMRFGPTLYALVAAVCCFAALGETAFAQSVSRGPYLQMGTPTSIVIKWRTDQATDSVVNYGTSVAGQNSSANGNGSGTEHEVRITGLTPDTEYFFSVGSSAEMLAGGDSSYSFVTAPPVGVTKSTRIWVLGDSGTANASARAVRDAFENFTGSRRPQLWLMLGDNAYDDGLDAEYQNAVFNMYPETLRQTVLWPTLGNHDGHTADSATQSGPYYDIFTLPTNAEAGGIASGTEAYYSFDFANIHFISLESHETDRSTGSAMMIWLENDLSTTTSDWIVAFWHHPPYTKGSHNSDTEFRLREMRTNAVPILERYGVDLILSGHSHSYERSYLIDGHHGSSSTFDESMKLDGGSGREDDTGSYDKSLGNGAPNQGAVFAVAGSSGKRGGGPLNHPAMFVGLNSLGSMVVDVSGNRLDAFFVDSTGATRDYFTITKGPDSTSPELHFVDAIDETTVEATFSENVDQGTAASVSNYAVNQGVGIVAATLNADQVTVTLTTTVMQRDIAHTLTVNNVKDLAGNQIATNSKRDFVLVSVTPPPDIVAPTVPTNIRSTDVTQTSASLEWDPSTDNVGVSEYRVRRDGQVVGTPTGTSFQDTGLTAGSVYAFTISTRDDAGNESAESDPLLVSTDVVVADDSGDSTVTSGGGHLDLISLLFLLLVMARRNLVKFGRSPK